jgi:hypothetical protein
MWELGTTDGMEWNCIVLGLSISDIIGTEGVRH